MKAQNETTTQIAAPHPNPLPRERGYSLPIPSYSYSPAPQNQHTTSGAYLLPSPLAGEGLGMRGGNNKPHYVGSISAASSSVYREYPDSKRSRKPWAAAASRRHPFAIVRIRFAIRTYNIDSAPLTLTLSRGRGDGPCQFQTPHTPTRTSYVKHNQRSLFAPLLPLREKGWG